MKFVAISDTHGQHERVTLPKGDALIHAGDISTRGNEAEIAEFFDWFKRQDFEYRILIAGNHDFYFERESAKRVREMIPKEVVYLNDSGFSLNGVNIWGSPITPWFNNWAFNRHRDAIKKHWELIPVSTDVLITHGPLFRTLDKTRMGIHAGCKELFQRVQEVKPRVHVCGHIHEAYGTFHKGNIQFINASLVNEKYELVNDPIVFEF
ncbi:metallophosphatase domain-containing protein [Pinibacter aurantiacus]|uniref:Metallophosphatase domain-containing protein n=1 Tax=Pinibacter aurantiacus TaxID=2851599 RepID=A0A9E2SA17_9BACT|nr:metallophosphatase domain-containing protein [Pinibacter aurantiacus]MBV4356125.1 metallophosphatase domain-containing protein [Pinibacter aurantiacus]